MSKTSWDWMAYVATIGMQLAFIWELVDMCQKGETSKLSWEFIVAGVVASGLGLAYGAKNGLVPIIVSGIVDILLSLLLLGIKTSGEIENANKEDK